MSEALHFKDEARALLAEIRKAPGTPLLLLTGNLGAGKTSFTKTLLFEGWGFDPARVQSPTFLKLLDYEVPGLGRVVHIDGYRVEESEAWERVGLEAYDNAKLWIVEWPGTFVEYIEARETLRRHLGWREAWDLSFNLDLMEKKVGPVLGPVRGGEEEDKDSGWGAPLRRLGWRRKSF